MVLSSRILANLTEIKFPYLDPVGTKLVSYLSPNRGIPRVKSGIESPLPSLVERDEIRNFLFFHPNLRWENYWSRTGTPVSLLGFGFPFLFFTSSWVMVGYPVLYRKLISWSDTIDFCLCSDSVLPELCLLILLRMTIVYAYEFIYSLNKALV